jgi:hypothetical protein
VRRGAGISIKTTTMRTAITVATQHDGGVVFLSDTTVPIQTQKEEIKRLKGLRQHAEFSSVELWESTSGVTSRVKFSNPKAAAPATPPAPPAEEPPTPPADTKRKK